MGRVQQLGAIPGLYAAATAVSHFGLLKEMTTFYNFTSAPMRWRSAASRISAAEARS